MTLGFLWLWGAGVVVYVIAELWASHRDRAAVVEAALMGDIDVRVDVTGKGGHGTQGKQWNDLFLSQEILTKGGKLTRETREMISVHVKALNGGKGPTL